MKNGRGALAASWSNSNRASFVAEGHVVRAGGLPQARDRRCSCRVLVQAVISSVAAARRAEDVQELQRVSSRPTRHAPSKTIQLFASAASPGGVLVLDANQHLFTRLRKGSRRCAVVASQVLDATIAVVIACATFKKHHQRNVTLASTEDRPPGERVSPLYAGMRRVRHQSCGGLLVGIKVR
jgi:hypothetical protein